MQTLFKINTFVNSRSTGRIAEGIGKLALSYGWNSYIAFGREEKASSSMKICIGTDWDVKYHGILTRLSDKHGLASSKATIQLIQEMDKINPDIIHLHNLHGYYLNYKLLFSYLSTLSTPVIWTLHDCWSYTGHCAYYDYAKCDKWKNGCGHCPQLDKYPKSFYDRSQKNWTDKKEAFTSLKNLVLVPVSHWLSRELSQSFFKTTFRTVIHNGVDVDIFKASPVEEYRKDSKINKKFVVLGVANVWEQRKGLNDFIQLAKLIPDDICIVLIGVSELQKRTLPDNILSISRTENIEQLVKWYSIADCFVNPTYEDNFPTTNIEALSCGTPVISYETGGSMEAITPETGFVVEKGNLSSLLEKIMHLKSIGKDRYSSLCRKHVELHFNQWDRYNEYFTLYNKLLLKC